MIGQKPVSCHFAGNRSSEATLIECLSLHLESIFQRELIVAMFRLGDTYVYLTYINSCRLAMVYLYIGLTAPLGHFI